MKIKKRRYIQFALALVALAIVAGTMLVNSPRVQQRVSVLLATELENRIGTRVNLGGVRWLFPSDIVIDSLSIDDQEGEQLVSVGRLAAKVEWMPLIRHRQLSIRNVRLYHPDIHLYKADAEGDYNYQFLIDAFASKQEKKKEPPRLSLRINSLLIRHANLSHRVGTGAGERMMKFDPQSLKIDDLSTHISLKTLSADSLNLIVRQLEFKEQSGLAVDNLYLRLVANRHGATLANFQLDLPHSSLRLDTIWVAYKASPSPSQGGVIQTSQPTADSHLKSKENKQPFQTSHPSLGGDGGGLVIKGRIQPSHITPSDLGSIVPQLKGITEKVHFDADFIGSPSRINVKSLSAYTQHRNLVLSAEAKWRKSRNDGHSLNASLSEGTLTQAFWPLLEEQAPDIYALIPQELVRIGNIATAGDLGHDSRKTVLDLQATTDAGRIETHAELDSKGNYTATLDGENIHIAQVIPTSPLTQTDITLQAQGTVGKADGAMDLNSLAGTFTATATHTRLLGYEYGTIVLDGEHSPEAYGGVVTLDDPNGRLHLQAQYDKAGRIPRYTVGLNADSLDLYAMNIIGMHEGRSFSARLNGDIRGNSFNTMVGEIGIDSLTMHREGDDYLLKEFTLYSTDPRTKSLALHSDFMDAAVKGDFTYQTLLGSLQAQLHNFMPSVCTSRDHSHRHEDNKCYARVDIYNLTPLRELLLMPLSIGKTASVETSLYDHTRSADLKVQIPQLSYNGTNFTNLHLDCNASDGRAVVALQGATQDEEGARIAIDLMATAKNDSVALATQWQSNPIDLLAGTFSTTANLSRGDDGDLEISIESNDSYTTINRKLWTLPPFQADISSKEITVHEFHFAHDSLQYLDIDGTIAQASADTLKVDFTGLDLGYLLTLVNLKGISFDGKVSGRADIAELYSEHPYIEADIEAEDFAFCNGVMGDVDGHIHWNQDDSQLQFTADVQEMPSHTTVVDGVVDFKQDELWIDIAADSTNVSFLNELLKSFMRDVKGHVYGHLTIGGPMDAIDLDGALLADVGFNLTPTDVDYHFRDTLRFMPGIIRFEGIEAFDLRHQKAIVTGDVTHNKLKDYAYDLYIDAQNTLGIDLPDTGHDSFYTTIYGTGGVHVMGGPTTPLTIDIQAQTEKGSVFALNLASQDVSSSEAFITFTDRTSTRNNPTIDTRPRNRRRRRTEEENSTSLDLGIRAHITPEATLKLVMNQAVDDHISASGSGDLQIEIVDDDINLFGTYTVDRGFYRLSLQDVINKDFDVISGSTVSFEGDPMAARLNITARHVVNYVPLRNLSPDMTGNTHVNCLLHIGGTLDAPTVAFNLELPQGTEEEKAVLRSYTSTEEQMNLQFIYLLGLGKFYTPDMAQSNAGTSNMESLISSTISGQINNLLSGIISNENWNLASNIRAENMMTGANDLGGDNWENMEIEGILEGRLLDNRLLINGNFGYRDNPMYASNFIGDFDIRYLLKGGFSLKGYNKTNDRYFSKTSLTTQGVGLVFQRDFDRYASRRKRKATTLKHDKNIK